MPKITNDKLRDFCLGSLLTFDFTAKLEAAILSKSAPDKTIKEFRSEFLEPYLDKRPDWLSSPVLFNPALLLGQLYIVIVLAHEILKVEIKQEDIEKLFEKVNTEVCSSKLLGKLRNALSHGSVEIVGPKWNFIFYGSDKKRNEIVIAECSFKQLRGFISTVAKYIVEEQVDRKKK